MQSAGKYKGQGLLTLTTNAAPNKPLAHELENCAVIEGSKPDK